MFRLIQAGPHTLFRLLTDRQCHAQLDGYGMLRVWGYARMPLLTVWLPGFTRRMRPAMERSLENLAALADNLLRSEPQTVSTGKHR